MSAIARIRAAHAACPDGWGYLSSAWQEPGDVVMGTAWVGNINEDDQRSEVMHVDTGNYYQPQHALPLAQFYAAMNRKEVGALLAEVDALRGLLLESRLHVISSGLLVEPTLIDRIDVALKEKV